MKAMLQKYAYGLIQYLYYLFGIPQPVSGVAKNMPMDGHEQGESEPVHEAPYTEPGASTADETVHTESVIAETPDVSVSPIEPPGPPPLPDGSVTSEPSVTNTDGNDTGLRDDLNAIREKIRTQSVIILGIEEKLTAMDNSRSLLERQEDVIRDLSTRLRQAEEAQLTTAITKPFISGIIQLFDTVWNANQEWLKQRPANIDAWVTNVLATIDGEIMALLNRHGVEMIRDTTDRLDPRKQRVVRTQIVNSVQDGTVLTHGKPGFYFNGQVARPEEVVMAIVKQGGERTQ